MPASVKTMVRRVHAFRDEIESAVVGPLEAELESLLSRAEVALARRMGTGLKLSTYPDGKIKQTVENIEEAGRIVQQLQDDIDLWIVGAGKKWANGAIPKIHQAGRELAKINLDVSGVNQDLLRSVFEVIQPSERALLKAGYQNTYQSITRIGDDVADWLRREMMDAVIEGIPIVGPGDTLVGRLVQNGRLKPIVVKTKNGRLITRTVKQQATTLARENSARIINHTHDTLGHAALGGAPVGINSNPNDSRTTDICRRASQQPPMTRREWQNSEFGLAPRYEPYHFCRSVIIWGRAEWFKDRAAV